MATIQEPQYAVYLKNGNERKTLFLLKPHYRQVIYTPYGVCELNLQAELPNYIEAVTKLYCDKTLAHIPFRKGLLSDEINQLIKETVQTNHSLSDMRFETIKSHEGYYPIINDQARSKFHTLGTTCLKINMYPQGSSDYRLSSSKLNNDPTDFTCLFKQLGEIQAQPTSTHLMWGKNREYIVDSDISFETILKQLEEQKILKYVISANLDATLVVIITPQKLTIVDPSGISENTRHIYYWANQLVTYLNGNSYNIKRSITADRLYIPKLLYRGSQNVSLVLAYYYLLLQTHNSTVSTEDIERHIMIQVSSDRNVIPKIAHLLYK